MVKALGSGSKGVAWLENLSLDRKQRVATKRSFLPSAEVTIGELLGSVVGPKLFTIYQLRGPTIHQTCKSAQSDYCICDYRLKYYSIV